MNPYTVSKLCTSRYDELLMSVSTIYIIPRKSPASSGLRMIWLLWLASTTIEAVIITSSFEELLDFLTLILELEKNPEPRS